MLIGTDLAGDPDLRLQGMREATHVANRMLGLIMIVFMIFLRAGIVPSLARLFAGRAP